MTSITTGRVRYPMFNKIHNNTESIKNVLGHGCVKINNVDLDFVSNMRAMQQEQVPSLLKDLLSKLNHTIASSIAPLSVEPQVVVKQPNVSVEEQVKQAFDKLPSSTDFLTAKQKVALNDLSRDVKEGVLFKSDISVFDIFLNKYHGSNKNPTALDRVNYFLMIRKEIKDNEPGLNDKQREDLNNLTENFINSVAKDGLDENSYAAGSSKGNGSGINKLNKFNGICNDLARMKSDLSFNREIANKINDALSKITPQEARDKLMEKAEELIFRPSVKEHGMMHSTLCSGNSGLGPFDTKKFQLGHEALIFDLLKDKLLDAVDKTSQAPAPSVSTSAGPANITINLDNSIHLNNVGNSINLNIAPTESYFNSVDPEWSKAGAREMSDEPNYTPHADRLWQQTSHVNPRRSLQYASLLQPGKRLQHATLVYPDNPAGQPEEAQAAVDMSPSQTDKWVSRTDIMTEQASGRTVDSLDSAQSPDKLTDVGKHLQTKPRVNAGNVNTEDNAEQLEEAQAAVDVNANQTGVSSRAGHNTGVQRSYLDMQKDGKPFIGSLGSAQALDKFAGVHAKSKKTATLVNRQGGLFQGMPRFFDAPPQPRSKSSVTDVKQSEPSTSNDANAQV